MMSTTRSLLHSSLSSNLLLMPGSVIIYFIYCILHLCLVLFCIWHFLLVKNIWLLTLFICSIPSSLSLFMIITFTSLSDRWHISTSLRSSSRVLSYSFIWNIFLCHQFAIFISMYLVGWLHFLPLSGIARETPFQMEISVTNV